MATKRPVSDSAAAAPAPARTKKTAKTSATHARRTKAASPAVETPAELNAPVIETQVAAAGPSHDEIARLAYALWLGRNGEGGSPEDDWFQAERQLRSRTSV
jgi:hypothetical protein